MSLTIAEKVARIVYREGGKTKRNQVTLKTIYQKAAKNWKTHRNVSRTSLESSIRAQIQRHSADSSQFGKNSEDMFEMLGNGVVKVTTGTAKRLSKELTA